ncbi:MAG: polysaccharide biosynthesis tyrosine autokinase [Victivallaceae bacterium]|nr:polysaccharide biosynthesis tyrosine autokinase [Victivallaceae bacterium]
MNEQRIIDFRYILGVFLKYCWIIALVALLAGILTYAVNKYFVSKIYTAKTIVCVMPNTLKDEVDSSTMRQNVGASYQEFLIINQLIYDINVMVSSHNLRTEMMKRLELEGEVTPELLENNRYTIAPELMRQTRMVQIEADSTSPEVAMGVANAMSDTLVDYLAENLKLKNVSVLDRAALPVKPSRPRVLLNTLIGIFLGGAGCFLLCFLKELFRGTVDSPDVVTQRLGATVVGTVTQLGEEIAESRQSTSRSNNIVTVEVDGKTPRFDVAESFRLLRTNLQYSLSKKDGAKVFVVTSTSPKDGKTFIASNIATIIASSGQRVLLVNCDLRKPALHKLFNLERNSGVVNILVGEATFDEVVNRNVLNMPLDVLASGPVPPNPSELLMSSDFAKIVTDNIDKYDYIILDAPPCLNISDAAIVGKLSDGVLFVISAAQTRIDSAAHALEQLRQLEIPIIGVILNRFSPKAWSGYGYSGYNYGYGYGYYSYYGYGE